MDRTRTIALVERYYAAFNASDGEAMLDCVSEGVRHHVNQGGCQVGKAAFRAFLSHMDECYRERLSDVAIMANDEGTRASAEFVVHGQYLATDDGLPEASGQEYVLPAGAFFEIEDGAIARIAVYYNLADWIRQVSG
ncbi:MAG TPA: ketosteroid isomerase-related protein [Novosphingobium sp.]|nr:ketosteroid isomerase-related protein [Novosphingobium sp.]